MRAPPREGPESPASVHDRERFDTAVAHWLRWLEHNRGRSPRTIAKYSGYLDRLAAWCTTPVEDPRLQPSTSDPLAVTAADLDCFCGLAAHLAGVAPRSRRPLVAAVRGFFAWRSKTERAENPAEQLAYPSFGSPLPAAITLAEAERMLMASDIETFTGLRNATMIAVLIGCGIRISGLVAMNESSLIWGHDEHGAEELTLQVAEKGKKDRLVPVPRETALLVRAYLGHADLEAVDRNVANGDRVLWISTRNYTVAEHEYYGERRRVGTRSFATCLEKIGKRAKVDPKHRHAHAFRHLYGTELTESDVTTLQIQGLMGHVNPKDSEIYTRLAQRKLRDVVDRANPIGKMRAPLLESLRAIDATQGRARAFAAPSGSYKRESRRHSKGRE